MTARMHGVESFKIIKQSSWHYTLFKSLNVSLLEENRISSEMFTSIFVLMLYRQSHASCSWMRSRFRHQNSLLLFVSRSFYRKFLDFNALQMQRNTRKLRISFCISSSLNWLIHLSSKRFSWPFVCKQNILFSSKEQTNFTIIQNSSFIQSNPLLT